MATKIIIDSSGYIYQPAGRIRNGKIYDNRDHQIATCEKDRVAIKNGALFIAGGYVMNDKGKQLGRLETSSIQSSTRLSPTETAAVQHFL